MHIYHFRKWLITTVGFDNAVFYSVLGQSWQICSGAVNLVLIAHFMTELEQGYLYTFQSLLAFQVLFDLSLPAVLFQYACHEMAHLKWHVKGIVDGDTTAKARLASLIGISLKWYSIAAALMLVLFLLFGYLFFIVKEVPQNPISWKIPWVLISVASSILIMFNPIVGIIEGCGRIAEVAIFRLIQDLIGGILYWVALSFGFGLLALPILFFSRVTAVLTYLCLYRRRFLIDLKPLGCGLNRVNFTREIWPFQWRFLLCSVSSLLASSLLIPIVFVAQGPVTAGKLGMTMTIITAIVSFSTIWMHTKVPLLCNLVALNLRAELDSTMIRVSKQVLFALLSLASGAIMAIAAVNLYFPSLASRIAAFATDIVLIFAILAGFPNLAASAYLRAHKVELTAVANISIAVMTILLTLLVSRYPNLIYIAIVQVSCNVILSVWVCRILIRFRSQIAVTKGVPAASTQWGKILPPP